MMAPAAAGCKHLIRRRGSRYGTGMKLAFKLPQTQAEKLRDEAKRLGLAPEELARERRANRRANTGEEHVQVG
jgi:hypothetical protein